MRFPLPCLQAPAVGSNFVSEILNLF